jgi:hypothetical protein
VFEINTPVFLPFILILYSNPNRVPDKDILQSDVEDHNNFVVVNI